MTPKPPHIYVGLDLGQRQDPSAIAVLERIYEPTGFRDHVTWELEYALTFRLRHVERIALGTPYIEIVRRTKVLMRSFTGAISNFWPVQFGHQANPYKTLVIDASGVGAPVLEMLRAADLGCAIVPITITSGAAAHSDHATGGYLVPRRDLLTRLRILLEKDFLRIAPAINDRQALIEEIITFEDRSTSRHDDLAIATALAIYQATQGLTL